MKKPKLKELLDVNGVQDFFIWYYILKEVGYTSEDFDKTIDVLMKEYPLTRYVANETIPYVIKVMERIEND